MTTTHTHTQTLDPITLQVISGVDSDSHRVLNPVSNSPAPRSWDSRMIEENDMR